MKNLRLRSAMSIASILAFFGLAPYSRKESEVAFRNMARIYTAALALEGYFVDFGRYPSFDSPKAFHLLCGPYFPADPFGESWSPTTSIQVSPDGKHYRIASGAFEEKRSADDLVFTDGTFVKWPQPAGAERSSGVGVVPETEHGLLDRGRANKTMHLMRLLATGMEAYAVDYNHYPAKGNRDEFERMLSPTYLREVPTSDSWGTDFSVTVSRAGYRIVSAGSDRVFDRSGGPGGPDCQAFSDDAVYENGAFLRSWASLLQEDGADAAGATAYADYEDARAQFEAYRKRVLGEKLDNLRAERTMSFMRRVGRAIEICPHRSGLIARLGDVKQFVEALSSWTKLELQTVDSWQTPWRIVLNRDGTGYRVISAGADRMFKEETWSKVSVSSDPREDLVYENGLFVRAFRPTGQASKQLPQ